MTYNTSRRQEIIDFFEKNSTSAFSLDAVCRELLGEGGGKSSLYRIAASLCREGVLKKITDSNSRHCKYQYIGGHTCHRHLHLKCTGCGKLIHLDEESSKRLEAGLLSAGDFRIDEGAFIFGKCGVCGSQSQKSTF